VLLLLLYFTIATCLTLQQIFKHSAYEAGETVRQETRLWDEKEKASKIMRVKEVIGIIMISSLHDTTPFRYRHKHAPTFRNNLWTVYTIVCTIVRMMVTICSILSTGVHIDVVHTRVSS
jgi:uncharacterized membrane protein